MHRLTLGSNLAPIPADAPVSWTGDPPAEEEARVVWDSLTEGVRYAALVERVAERLFRRDLDTFGVSADVGFFQSFYVAHARHIVTGLAGTRLRIGGPA